MKTLFLIRHAKSGHDAGLKDRDRPLNERGLQDAREMGRRLAKRGVRPDRVISSPAVRARTTAELIAAQLGIGASDIAIDDRLYAASPATLLAVIREQEDRFACVMIFGHNPEFTEVAQRLSGGEITDMPTCGVAELHFDAAPWAELGETPASQVHFESPKTA
jgi:phosphohistidine phosphatase